MKQVKAMSFKEVVKRVNDKATKNQVVDFPHLESFMKVAQETESVPQTPITAKEIITLIKSALKEFGEYDYQDKGAREVMDIDPIVTRLLLYKTAKEVLEVLTEVEKFEDSEPLLTDVICTMDGSEETSQVKYLDELFESELFKRYY